MAGLQKGQIDHLVLVGGTTRVPVVQERVQQFFGRQAVVGINPDEVVSVGAAIFGASLIAPTESPYEAPGGQVDFRSTFMGDGDDAWMQGLDDEGAHPPPQPGQQGGQPAQGARAAGRCCST